MASATANEIVMVVGPDVDIDRSGFERWCAEWGEECAVDLSARFARDEAELVRALEPQAMGHARGAVIGPGSAAGSELVRATAERTGVPVAWVDMLEAARVRPPYLHPTTTSIRGRGIFGFRWAIAHLLQRLAWPYEVVPYGSGRDRVGDLRLPAGTSERVPVAVTIHGGFWRERWERDTIEPLAVHLARRGFATWNLEYRREGPFGGGWPATGGDVAAGIDHLAEIARRHPIDLDRVVFIGHSAGGQLALWAVRRRGSDRPARVTPRLVVSLAGVLDLREAARRGLGDTGNATADFLGGPPEQLAERYDAASPTAALPLGVAQLIVQGRRDKNHDLVDLNRRYVQAACAAGDPVDALELDEADHFQLIDPASWAWLPVAERIEQAIAPRGQTEASTANY